MSIPHVVIVGGGIAGLAAAERLSRTDGPLRVTLLEASGRLGGMIATERADGFVIEQGPDVMLASKPAGVSLATRVGLGSRMVGTDARSAYVLQGTRLLPLPAGMSGLVPARLGPLLGTPLLSPMGKLRVAMDALIPSRAGGRDESIEAFVVRRVGREMYERIVEPLLSGIYAGDGGRLSIESTFPQLRSLEREHGGLLRGAMATRRAAPANGKAGFVSFQTGLAELVTAMGDHLKDASRDGRFALEVRTGVAIRRLSSEGPSGTHAVETVNGDLVTAETIVLATPAHVSSLLLRAVNPDAAETLGGIEHVSTAIVSVGYSAAAVPRTLDATGYLVPRRERRHAFACTWSSAKFAGRAPADSALFRLFFGGAGREEVLAQTDAELVSLARAELRDVLGVLAPPRITRVTRWERAMPQYTLGHLERMARLEGSLASTPWLALAGNAYAGVGIPDCIRSGESAAERVLATLKIPSRE